MLQPGLVVLPIVNANGIFCELQGLKCIDHHGQFFRFGLTNAGFVGTRMRTMGNAGRMQGNMARTDVGAAHKVTIHIIQHFIGIDVGMVVWSRYRLGVVIVQAGGKMSKQQTRWFQKFGVPVAVGVRGR